MATWREWAASAAAAGWWRWGESAGGSSVRDSTLSVSPGSPWVSSEMVGWEAGVRLGASRAGGEGAETGGAEEETTVTSPPPPPPPTSSSPPEDEGGVRSRNVPSSAGEERSEVSEE